jgi:hypothetical protein
MSKEITKNDESEDMEETVPPKNESFKKDSSKEGRAGAPPRVLKGHLPDPPREKRERTPAQIAAFERARASREANIKKKNEDSKRLAEYDAMLLKQKLVDKANKIKLKTMKKMEVIESISSEDDEVVIEKPPLSKGVPKGGQPAPEPKPEPKEEPKKVAAPSKKVMPYKFV